MKTIKTPTIEMFVKKLNEYALSNYTWLGDLPIETKNNEITNVEKNLFFEHNENTVLFVDDNDNTIFYGHINDIDLFMSQYEK